MAKTSKRKPYLFLGGVTGSYDSVEERGAFGGATTAFAIIFDNYAIVIDQGSGATNVIKHLRKMGIRKFHILFTHYHSDHQCGLQSNGLLLAKGLCQGLYGPQLKMNVIEIYDRAFNAVNWPVSPEVTGVTHSFGVFPPGSMIEIGTHGEGVTDRIKTYALNHPGGAVAYRVPTEYGDIVIATDHEAKDRAGHAAYADFVSGAAMLVVDIQYRQSEFDGKTGISDTPAQSRVGWGHSSPEMIRDALTHCSVLPRTIVGVHHDPMRSVGDLKRMEREAISTFSGHNFTFGRQNHTVEML